MSGFRAWLGSVASRLFKPASAGNSRGGRRSMLSPGGASRGAFAGAEVNRLLLDWLSTGMSADDDLRGNIKLLRGRARELERNNSPARHYLRLLVTNVLGHEGMKLRARTRNSSGDLIKSINVTIEEAWDLWCCDPMLDGTMDMVSAQYLMLKQLARDGEVLVRKWRIAEPGGFGFKLEILDPESLDESLNRAAGSDGNEIRMGVEVDAEGKRVAYYLLRKPNSTGGRHQRVPAAEIIHEYDVERVGQSRGYTWFCSVMVGLKMLAGYTEAELVAARISAAKMGFFQRKSDGGNGTELTADNGGTFTAEANPGTFGVLPDGYELATFSPDHPSGAFGAFVKASLRDVSVGLGPSYNALANDLEGVSYGSLRGGLIIERDVWRVIQRRWIKRICTPIFTEWLKAAILNGALKLDGYDASRYVSHTFHARGWAWVDPLKDTQAGVLALQNGLTSRTDLLAEQGRDFEEVLERLAEEDELAAQYGVSIVPAVPTAPDANSDPASDGEDKPTAEDDGEQAQAEADRKQRRLELIRRRGYRLSHS